MLPTPTVVDMGSNYTPDEWEAWKAKQKAAHQNGNGHGASLTQEAISLLPTTKSRELATAVASTGESTSKQSDDGKQSPGPHHRPHSKTVTAEPDSLPLSWNG